MIFGPFLITEHTPVCLVHSPLFQVLAYAQDLTCRVAALALDSIPAWRWVEDRVIALSGMPPAAALPREVCPLHVAARATVAF